VSLAGRARMTHLRPPRDNIGPRSFLLARLSDSLVVREQIQARVPRLTRHLFRATLEELPPKDLERASD